MSIRGEQKKFELKHVFTDIPTLERGKSHDSQRECHFNMDWFVSIFINSGGLFVYLDCPRITDSKKYKIKTYVNLKLLERSGREEKISGWARFSEVDEHVLLKHIGLQDIEKYSNGEAFSVGCEVEVLEMIGIKKRKFQKSEFSDVALIINDRKFHVLKKYLGYHSTYFKTLFFGNFEETGQSEVELKNIDPKDFQNYLDIIYGESEVTRNTVKGILKLADFFDTKIAMKRCESYLMKKTKMPLKQKFGLANKYKLDRLMKKCLSKIKKRDDIRSILPANIDSLDQKLSNELLLIALYAH